MALLNVATGWLLFSSLSVVTGVVIGRWAVLRPGGGDFPHVEELRHRASHLGFGAALTLGVSLVLVLLSQLLEFRDPFVPWTEDAALLLEGTPWGTAWLMGISATLLLSIGFAVAARGRPGLWWPVSALALALGAFPALTGHANAGEWRLWTLVADTVHVWAVGGWIGGLGLILWLDHRHRTSDFGGGAGILPHLVSRFSPVAMTSVATLVATGVFASWVHLYRIGDLVGTQYGQTLLLKVALAGVVLAFGAWNFRRLSPRLGDAQGQEAMRRSATVEFLVANLVLMVTAILVRTSPP